MGQNVHPVGMRLGITRTWKSYWYHPRFSNDNGYSRLLKEDLKIQSYIKGIYRKNKRKRNIITNIQHIYRKSNVIHLLLNFYLIKNENRRRKRFQHQEILRKRKSYKRQRNYKQRIKILSNVKLKELLNLKDELNLKSFLILKKKIIQNNPSITNFEIKKKKKVIKEIIKKDDKTSSLIELLKLNINSNINENLKNPKILTNKSSDKKFKESVSSFEPEIADEKVTLSRMRSNLKYITNTNMTLLMKRSHKMSNINYNAFYLTHLLCNLLKNPRNKRRFYFLYKKLNKRLKNIAEKLKFKNQKTFKIKGFRMTYAGKLWSKGRSKSKRVYFGSISSHNLKQYIDFNFMNAITKYGATAFKIWINYLPSKNYPNSLNRSKISYNPILNLLHKKKRINNLKLFLFNLKKIYNKKLIYNKKKKLIKINKKKLKINKNKKLIKYNKKKNLKNIYIKNK